MRVDRNFAFVDLCGFTSFTATEGDDRATRVLADFRSLVRDIASRRAVRVAKWLGDGAMIVGVEPEPLVSAVLEMERRMDDGHSPLTLRAGLANGRVILFEGDDYIGTTVNLAARLCDAAGPRQVLAVPDLGRYCPGWVVASDVYEVVIPGFGIPVDLVRLFPRPPGADAVTDPVCGLVLGIDVAVPRPATNVEGTTWFCSDSCADTWVDSYGVVADPDAKA